MLPVDWLINWGIGLVDWNYYFRLMLLSIWRSIDWLIWIKKFLLVDASTHLILIDWLIECSIDWLIECSIDWLIDWVFDDWLIYWLIECLSYSALGPNLYLQILPDCTAEEFENLVGSLSSMKFFQTLHGGQMLVDVLVECMGTQTPYATLTPRPGGTSHRVLSIGLAVLLGMSDFIFHSCFFSKKKIFQYFEWIIVGFFHSVLSTRQSWWSTFATMSFRRSLPTRPTKKWRCSKFLRNFALPWAIWKTIKSIWLWCCKSCW